MNFLGLGLLLMISLSGCAGLTQGWTTSSPPKSDAEIERGQIMSDYGKVTYIKFQKDSPDYTDPITQPDDIGIFSDAPTGKFVEIGAISIQMNDTYDYLTKVLKFKASTIGANAIMKYEMADVPVKSSGGGAVTSNGAIVQSSKIRYQKKVSGVAIRFVKPH